MGANLCGTMLFGPEKLDVAKLQQAVAHVTRLKVEADQIREAVDNNEPELGDDAVLKLLREAAETLGWELKELLDQVLTENFDPKELVDEFVEVWNGMYRDATCRRLPDRYQPVDGPQMICLFAGERTWGDGPDPQSGWAICERAVSLGVTEILGIE